MECLNCKGEMELLRSVTYFGKRFNHFLCFNCGKGTYREIDDLKGEENESTQSKI